MNIQSKVSVVVCSTVIIFIFMLTGCGCDSNGTVSWQRLIKKKHLTRLELLALAKEYSSCAPDSNKAQGILGALTKDASPDLLEFYVDELLAKSKSEMEFGSALGILTVASAEIGAQSGRLETIQPSGGFPQSPTDYRDTNRREEIVRIWRSFARKLKESSK